MKVSRPILLLLLLPSIFLLHPQKHTVGVIQNSKAAYDGYTLFSPIYDNNTYLMENSGKIVHEWKAGNLPGKMAYLTENLTLMRSEMFPSLAEDNPFHYGGSGGRLREYSWDGKLLWEFNYSNLMHLAHHDFSILPNGNILMIAWEKKTKEEAMAAGRNPELINENFSEIWPDEIIEVEPTKPYGGKIVWEWHLWDHLIQDFDPEKANYGDVSAHPELIDINFVWDFPPAKDMADWVHLNSIDYNKKLDQIIVSSPALNEIWIIDHNTTTEEAAAHTGGGYGMGGDIIYRWGNPQSYHAGNSSDKKLFGQHDIHWIKDGFLGAGDLLLFNNGWGRSDGNYSSVLELSVPMLNGKYFLESDGTYGPSGPVWEYVSKNKSSFYSSKISSAQRLENGNTLIDEGDSGTFFEVTPAKKVVWKYINPYSNAGKLNQGEEPRALPKRDMNAVFKIRKYPKNLFEGLI